jgi:hypothetical protein
LPSQQPSPTVQNHFIAGLKTEFTGLNFPENAATQTQNCVYTLTGDVYRRGGINYENNFQFNNIGQPSVAYSAYKWKNVGGDGQTQILVQQIGNTLYFFLSTNVTNTNPLSTTLLSSTVTITTYQAIGNTNNPAITECTYTDGNGFLIVFHKDCDPIYCTYNSGNQIITPTQITLQIRDTIGIPETNAGIPIQSNFRPTTLTPEHNYNLINQGWTFGAPWTGIGSWATGSWPSITTGVVFNISSQTNTTAITNGSELSYSGTGQYLGGTFISVTGTAIVSNYVSPFTSMTLTITSQVDHYGGGNAAGVAEVGNVNIQLVNEGFVTTWATQIGNYPSNADIWWLYKATVSTVVGTVTTAVDQFSPGTTVGYVQPTTTPAPKGYYLLNPFRQQRTQVSGVSGLTDVITTTRPTNGCWYQGRVFYTGVNASQQPTGDEPYYTWTENIYFSQIIETPQQFGYCYQANDPTNQDLFALLPSDGGVITIQGCGAIYKLFPLRFGVLVFASNGVWFIGGSTGVGFSANDYTVTKISNIESISNPSFIEVMGYPYFWNQEGIYRVVPSSQPGSAHSPDIQLDVQNLTLGTILTYYGNIPPTSKFYARGDYDQLNYIVSWCYRSTLESGVSNRYQYDTILCYNTVTQAFYPYTLPASVSTVYDIKWVQNPGGINNVNPVFKYFTLDGTNVTFSEENDFTRYLDFFNENNTGYNYVSSFMAGYNLQGQGLRKVQMPYLYMFSRNPGGNAFIIQSVWDYAGTGNSGKWSTRQVIRNNQTDFSMMYRKIRLRGRGLAVQIFVSSVQGQPFDLMGWTIWSETNPGI